MIKRVTVQDLNKVFTFIRVYGFTRSAFKVFGRLRYIPWVLRYRNVYSCEKVSVGVVGCGQFAFSTLSYFLRKSNRVFFKFAYDPDHRALESFCVFNGVRERLDSEDAAMIRDADLVYIASNHSSHAKYAINYLKRGSVVYIEKPLVVNWEQFWELGALIAERRSSVYVGYNRPFSKAIVELSSLIGSSSGPMSLSCFVVGHQIDKDHWYRHAEEGTRVCGNLGHWLDLAIHLLLKRQTLNYLDIRVVYSDEETSDENITVVLVSDASDLVSLTLTSHSEPFEGINESISFHQAGVIADIQDFRRAVFWVGDKRVVRHYRPKDVGHRKAILQPIEGSGRDLNEIRLSSALMLEVMDLVKNRAGRRRMNLCDRKYQWS